MTFPPDAERMSAELRDELARNDARRKVIDPRTMPLRFHHLKAMGRSAAHAFEAFQGDGDETLATRLGAGAHAILLGKSVRLFDKPARNGKGGKAPRSGEQWDTFCRENPGATILIRSEWDTAMRVASAIRSNPEAESWLTSPGAVYETSIQWAQGGRARQSTPDIRCPVRITEVKTTRSAAPDQFKWDVKRFCYHAQLVDQRNAALAKFGTAPRELCIIAVEKKRPFVVQTYRLTERDIEQGERIMRFWFEQYMNAERSNYWGGYAAGTLDLDLPSDDDDPGEIAFGDDETDEDDEDLA